MVTLREKDTFLNLLKITYKNQGRKLTAAIITTISPIVIQGHHPKLKMETEYTVKPPRRS